MWGHLDAVSLNCRLSGLIDETQLHINAKKRVFVNVYDDVVLEDAEIKKITVSLSEKQLYNPLGDYIPCNDTVLEDLGYDSVDLYLDQQKLEQDDNVDKFGPADPGVEIPLDMR